MIVGRREVVAWGHVAVRGTMFSVFLPRYRTGSRRTMLKFETLKGFILGWQNLTRIQYGFYGFGLSIIVFGSYSC